MTLFSSNIIQTNLMQLNSSEIRHKFVAELYDDYQRIYTAKICGCCKSNMAPISSRSVALITALYHDKVMNQRRRQLRQKTLLLYLKQRVFILRTFLLCLIFMTRSRAKLSSSFEKKFWMVGKCMAKLYQQ